MTCTRWEPIKSIQNKPGPLPQDVKMASVEPKRPHVLTKRMEEFMRLKQCRGGVPGVSGDRVLLCPRDGCNKVLTSTPGLRYHMRTHVADLQPYTCIKCKKHFKSFNGLKYHRERSSCENTVSAHIQDPIRIKNAGSTPDSSPLHEPGSLAMDMDSPSPSGDEKHDWLRDLAIIATGPQSPLMDQSGISQNEKPEPNVAICALGPLLHSYASPQPVQRCLSHTGYRSPSPPPQLIRAEHAYSSLCPHPDTFTSGFIPSKRQRSYSCPSSTLKQLSSSHHTDMPDLSLDPVWLCFMAGTKIKFATHCNASWNSVEELAKTKKEEDLAPHGLCVMMMEETKSDRSSSDPPPTDGSRTHPAPMDLTVQIHLTTDMPGQPDLITQCSAHCPFFVRGKGWSSFTPEQTVEHYGIPCMELEVGDVCLPPNHPDALDANNMIESFKSADLSPMDTSAVLALSGMAKLRREQEMSPPYIPCSPYRSPTKTPEGAPKGKRPMNGFMLFAKRYRMEYMQLYPGKDNRAISVLLGDHWKHLDTEDRKRFTNEAKMLAEQQRRLHPDCWKRKRTLSTSALER